MNKLTCLKNLSSFAAISGQLSWKEFLGKADIHRVVDVLRVDKVTDTTAQVLS